MAERRRFRRADHTRSVHFEFPNPDQSGKCLSRDLSEGGVRVHLFNYIPENTELALKVHLAGEDVAECTGRVVWIEKDRFGESYQAGFEFARSDSALNFQKEISEFLSYP